MEAHVFLMPVCLQPVLWRILKVCITHIIYIYTYDDNYTLSKLSYLIRHLTLALTNSCYKKNISHLTFIAPLNFKGALKCHDT